MPENSLYVWKICSIIVAIWSCVFCVLQMALMGWQTPVIKQKKDEAENRPYPDFGIDPQRSRFPGLYNRYVESAERKRYVALYALQLVMILVSVLQLITSLLLLYGCAKAKKNAIWPWFPCVIFNSLLSVGYALVWWMGDPFRYWLTLSIYEFLTSIPINSVSVMIVALYYSKIPTVPKRSQAYKYQDPSKPPLNLNPNIPYQAQRQIDPRNQQMAPRNQQIDPRNQQMAPRNPQMAPRNQYMAPRNPQMAPQTNLRQPYPAQRMAVPPQNFAPQRAPAPRPPF